LVASDLALTITEQTPSKHRANLQKHQNRKNPGKNELKTEHNKHYRTLVVGFGSVA
jgi:hypothetical protein